MSKVSADYAPASGRWVDVTLQDVPESEAAAFAALDLALRAARSNNPDLIKQAGRRLLEKKITGLAMIVSPDGGVKVSVIMEGA